MEEIEALKQKIKELEAENRRESLKSKFYSMGGKSGSSQASGSSFVDVFIARYGSLEPSEIDRYQDQIREETPSLFGEQSNSENAKLSWSEAMRLRGHKVG
jgi:hypothetical protein